MAYTHILLHVVWGTKKRAKALTKDIREIIYKHILENAATKNIHIVAINGWFDHVYCLLSLNADMSIAKCMQLIKGESAFWINRQKMIASKFEWADEYYAVSVSKSNADSVIKYIQHQEEHHRIHTYAEELAKIAGLHKFPFESDE